MVSVVVRATPRLPGWFGASGSLALKEWFPLLSGATDPRATGDAEKREAHDFANHRIGSLGAALEPTRWHTAAASGYPPI